ncbi:MAG TPA: hypothetical protein VFN55_10040 [Solirubrobacteraceae bacterium]|nr:hypothetical protein [Solirubrobacteraceae bacterium]
MTNAIEDQRPAGAPPTPAEELFTPLLTRNAAGRGWLPELLSAAPGAQTALGELAQQPGWLQTALAVHGARDRLACFEYPAVPSPEWLTWMIDHPDALTVPAQQPGVSDATRRLRAALIGDEPPGARERAQDQAHKWIRSGSRFTAEWWRLEATGMLDAILITDRLVVTVLDRGSGPLQAATPWYPQRSMLVRTLEAARQAAPDRAWATLLLSAQPEPDGDREAFAATLPQAAPHLEPAERDALARAYLGELTYAQARAITAG